MMSQSMVERYTLHTGIERTNRKCSQCRLVFRTLNFSIGYARFYLSIYETYALNRPIGISSLVGRRHFGDDLRSGTIFGRILKSGMFTYTWRRTRLRVGHAVHSRLSHRRYRRSAAVVPVDTASAHAHQLVPETLAGEAVEEEVNGMVNVDELIVDVLYDAVPGCILPVRSSNQ